MPADAASNQTMQQQQQDPSHAPFTRRTDDLTEYALYLGFDLERPDLLWIAEEALRASTGHEEADESKFTFKDCLVGDRFLQPLEWAYQLKYMACLNNGGRLPPNVDAWLSSVNVDISAITFRVRHSGPEAADTPLLKVEAMSLAEFAMRHAGLTHRPSSGEGAVPTAGEPHARAVAPSPSDAHSTTTPLVDLTDNDLASLGMQVTPPASMRAEDGEDGATNEIIAPSAQQQQQQQQQRQRHQHEQPLDDHVVERTAIITRGAGQPLGLDLAEITGQVVIVKVHDGTAAAACRQLVVGDIITAVGNTSAFGMSKSDLCQLIRAMPEGFPVTITVVGRPLGVTQAAGEPSTNAAPLPSGPLNGASSSTPTQPRPPPPPPQQQPPPPPQQQPPPPPQQQSPPPPQQQPPPPSQQQPPPPPQQQPPPPTSADFVHFDFNELSAGTDHFSPARELGAGGFGKVFLCSPLPSLVAKHPGQCAVKVQSLHAIDAGLMGGANAEEEAHAQGLMELINEIELLGMCRHPNLVTLLGYSLDPRALSLVYPLMPAGNLEDLLDRRHEQSTTDEPHRSDSWGRRQALIRTLRTGAGHAEGGGSEAVGLLGWHSRVRILTEATRGLSYLHTHIPGGKGCILHRDVKPSNVLLDERMTAKLAE